MLKRRFNELDAKDPFQRVLLKAFAESDPEPDDVITIEYSDCQFQSVVTSNFTFDAPQDPMQYGIHSKGTITYNTNQNAVLLDITETMGDPVTIMLNLDNDYLYYFYK